jgi:hypothetical protein
MFCADIIEEILSEEIVDETDQYSDNVSKQHAKRITSAAVMRGCVQFLLSRFPPISLAGLVDIYICAGSSSASTASLSRPASVHPAWGARSRAAARTRRSFQMGARLRCGVLPSAIGVGVGKGVPGSRTSCLPCSLLFPPSSRLVSPSSVPAATPHPRISSPPGVLYRCYQISISPSYYSWLSSHLPLHMCVSYPILCKSKTALFRSFVF